MYIYTMVISWILSVISWIFQLQVWELETLECIHVLQCHGGGSVYSLAVTSQHIICGTYENKINVRELERYSEVCTCEVFPWEVLNGGNYHVDCEHKSRG